ncbi:MAG: NAD(P)H-dependent oxidoreductase [Deltaproteobacteria bacterium]|nr:NAD(P)H-dependent oxidoreductase [Candidatus Anaeroferrophillus wilburensis]MBN2887911.1 NAD(P)H-dependent oxidoreductase [Deltaproteobacteria bacterium]
MANVLIVYDSLRGGTKRIADLIAEMLAASGHQVTAVKSAKASVADLEAADAVLLGGPTYHKDLIGPMKTFLFKIAEAKLAGKPGAAFASYGWSGESLGILEDTMKNLLQMNLLAPGLAVKQTPAVAKVKASVEPFVKQLDAGL